MMYFQGKAVPYINIGKLLLEKVKWKKNNRIIKKIYIYELWCFHRREYEPVNLTISCVKRPVVVASTSMGSRVSYLSCEK